MVDESTHPYFQQADPEDLCECGDFRKDHETDTGECRICCWSPSNPNEPCKAFRFFAPAEVKK